MKKNFLIAFSNLRKAKGQSAAIFILILLASVVLNLWLMLAMDYRANFERLHAQQNSGHVNLVVDRTDKEFSDFLIDTLEKDSRTEEYSIDRSMNMVGSFDYNGGNISTVLVFLEEETALSRTVGKIDIVEKGSDTSGIFLPLLYRSKSFAVGKSITLAIGSNSMSFPISGFFNSTMAGSHNCSMVEMVLTSDLYRELAQKQYAPESLLCSVRIDDKGDSQNYEAMLTNAIATQFPNARTSSNSYNLVIQSRYVSQMICSGIMCAMAFFILLIALVVIASNIINYIQENMVNLGTLKAVGYQSHQLIIALLTQFLFLTVLAVTIGTMCSYLLFPAINSLMIAQTGIPYSVHFLPLQTFLTLLILGTAVGVSVWLSSRRIKKIQPIVALRSGILNHNFKRNHLPLCETKLPLNSCLALKTSLSNIKHNLTIALTMMVLSLIVVFSGLTTENVIRDSTPFISLIAGETADSCINVEIAAEDSFLKDIDQDSRVEKIYLYTTIEVRHVDGLTLAATISEDFSKVNAPDIIYSGRFPRYDNEIAIAGKYAKERRLKLGNEIAITANGQQAKFIISGFSQVSNNLGKDCVLTRQGYERLGRLQNVSYYLNLADGTDIDLFNTDYMFKYGKNVNTVINISSVIDAAGDIYISLMQIIVISILILSVIIIAFVLYLLVRTLLNNKKRDYGILKALGFSTRQLIVQTAISFMPAIIISTVVGITISSFIINPLTALFLSGIGIVKCTFTVPIAFISIAGLGIIALSFAIACLLSLRIKRIAPRTLLAGE